MLNPVSKDREETRAAAPRLVGAKAYLLAVFCIGTVFALRLVFDPLWHERLPYLGFFFAVVAVARCAGVGPILLTVLASVLLGDWFFVAPRHSLAIAEPVDQINTVLFVGLSAVVLLVSARMRRTAGRELASRERIAELLECTSDAVCTLDRQWRVTFFNERAAHWTKLPAAQVLGGKLWELWPDLVGTRFEQEYRRVMEQRQTVHFEDYYPPYEQWIEAHACPHGEGLAIFFRNITVRKRAEAARAQLAAIVESSDDAIIGESLEGLIVAWNAAAEKLYGYPSTEALGHSFAMLFPIERSHEITPVLERVRRGERVSHFETVQRKKDGTLVDVSLTISPVLNMDSQAVGVSITGRDVSERKRAEQERERLLRELRTALTEVKTLSGLLPICARCKKIRDDKGYWNQIEFFIRERSNADFTHSICPECATTLYPELFEPQK